MPCLNESTKRAGEHKEVFQRQKGRNKNSRCCGDHWALDHITQLSSKHNRWSNIRSSSCIPWIVKKRIVDWIHTSAQYLKKWFPSFAVHQAIWDQFRSDRCETAREWMQIRFYKASLDASYGIENDAGCAETQEFISMWSEHKILVISIPKTWLFLSIKVTGR